MEKEQLKQEIKNAIDQVRYNNEEEINGKWYLNTTILVGEIVTSNVIDEIIDKHIPEGAVVLTKEELIELNEKGFTFDTTTGGKINIIEMAREQARKETAKDVYELIGARCNKEKEKTYQEVIDSPYVAENETEKETMARHEGYLYGLGVSQSLVKKYYNEIGVGVKE